MNKILIIIATLCCSATAHAIDFNVDALRELRAQGEQMIEEIHKPRTLEIGKNLCLDATGGGNVKTSPCQGSQKSQLWQLDDQWRIVNDNGECLAAPDANKRRSNIVTKPCSNGDQFMWHLAPNGQLVHGKPNSGGQQKCAHAAGNINKSGGNVILIPCKGGPRQTWE